MTWYVHILLLKYCTLYLTLPEFLGFPSGKQWTLGNYTDEFGGTQVRGKHTFGIYVPLDKSANRFYSGTLVVPCIIHLLWTDGI